MSCFESTDNDFDLELIKFSNYYLNELTYYGTSKTEHMMTLITIGQKLTTMEKNIIDNYYNHYVEIIIKNIDDPNIYYMQKILFTFTNIILKMVILFMSNESNTEEYKYKSIYLIGCVENYINKIIEPIETKLKYIIKSNTIFKLDYPLTYLKKYIFTYKSKFTSRDKFEKIKKVVELFESFESFE